MDPVTCPMCQGAIPGKEIHTLKTCPSCGADLSALIRRRLAQLAAKTPPPQPTSFRARAAWFSLLAPCLGIVVYLFGRRALGGSSVGMLVLGAVCSLVIAGGFILAVIALFAPKGEKTGTMRKAIAGIFINGLLIAFAILSIFTRQKVAASENKTPNPPRKGWSYISGK
jgi:hypothetical protein